MVIFFPVMPHSQCSILCHTIAYFSGTLPFADSLFIYMNVSMFVTQCCRRSSSSHNGEVETQKYQVKVRKEGKTFSASLWDWKALYTSCALKCLFHVETRALLTFFNISITLRQNIDAWAYHHNESVRHLMRTLFRGKSRPLFVYLFIYCRHSKASW